MPFNSLTAEQIWGMDETLAVFVEAPPPPEPKGGFVLTRDYLINTIQDIFSMMNLTLRRFDEQYGAMVDGQVWAAEVRGGAWSLRAMVQIPNGILSGDNPRHTLNQFLHVECERIRQEFVSKDIALLRNDDGGD